ncbi:hypothetical protein INT48_000020 [Thamnidium elegans]|uniref:Uncharacterized protein n=1 Tax=Thamnidium elegans TaxID=101142 RepID=A0A8H7SMW4_9FUNG|nr:hypothetical protein INT48_000020 [Thamnidium elegans]
MVRTDGYCINFILAGPERQSNKLPNLDLNDFTPEEINKRFHLWGVDPGQISIFTASDGHDTDPHQLRKYSTAEYYTRTGVLHCLNQTCNTLWQRDINASRNMHSISWNVIMNHEVPSRFQRQ